MFDVSYDIHRFNSLSTIGVLWLAFKMFTNMLILSLALVSPIIIVFLIALGLDSL